MNRKKFREFLDATMEFSITKNFKSRWLIRQPDDLTDVNQRTKCQYPCEECNQFVARQCWTMAPREDGRYWKYCNICEKRKIIPMVRINKNADCSPS